MPTYEYECKSCKYNFDVFQSMKDEPLKICPKCGKELRRLINGGNGVIFKGNGFYVTDKNARGDKSAKDGKSGDGKASGDSGKGGDDSKAAPAKTGTPCSGCAKSDSCPKAANS